MLLHFCRWAGLQIDCFSVRGQIIPAIRKQEIGFRQFRANSWMVQPLQSFLAAAWLEMLMLVWDADLGLHSVSSFHATPTPCRCPWKEIPVHMQSFMMCGFVCGQWGSWNSWWRQEKIWGKRGKSKRNNMQEWIQITCSCRGAYVSRPLSSQFCPCSLYFVKLL